MLLERTFISSKLEAMMVNLNCHDLELPGTQASRPMYGVLSSLD